MEAFYFPLFPILGCSLFASLTGIIEDSKALVWIFQPWPKLFKVERNHSSCAFQCAQRTTLRSVGWILVIKIIMSSSLPSSCLPLMSNGPFTSYHNCCILICNTSNLMTAEVTRLLYYFFLEFILTVILCICHFILLQRNLIDLLEI